MNYTRTVQRSMDVVEWERGVMNYACTFQR